MATSTRHIKPNLVKVAGVGLAGFVLTIAGCTSAPEPTVPPARDIPATNSLSGAAAIIAQASERTAAAGSARFSGSISGQALPGGAGNTDGGSTIKMAGAYDFDNSRFEATAGMVVLGENAKIQIITINDNTYVQSPQFGKGRWLTAPLSDLGVSESFTDPQKVFKELQNVSNLTEAGPDTVGGVKTTKYQGTLDLNKALEGAGVPQDQVGDETVAGSSDMTVWIDDAGRVVKMTSKTTASVGDRDLSNKATVRFYDFGTELEIKEPPPGDVTDISDLNKIPGS